MTVICTGFSTPEKKLFLLFWYYILVLIVLLTYFTVHSQNVNSTVERLQEYFSCSIAGYKPECKVYRKQVEDITWPSYYLDSASKLLLSSVTLSKLIYVLQFHHIKKYILNFFTLRTYKNTIAT